MAETETVTVYVVDEDGATFFSYDRDEAEKRLVHEAWTGAVHLTITKAEAPTGLDDETLIAWIITNVPPITCDAQ